MSCLISRGLLASLAFSRRWYAFILHSFDQSRLIERHEHIRVSVFTRIVVIRRDESWAILWVIPVGNRAVLNVLNDAAGFSFQSLQDTKLFSRGFLRLRSLVELVFAEYRTSQTGRKEERTHIHQRLHMPVLYGPTESIAKDYAPVLLRDVGPRSPTPVNHFKCFVQVLDFQFRVLTYSSLQSPIQDPASDTAQSATANWS